MSTTTIYVITKDGTLEEFAEYRNSWGSAMAVWSSLCFRYIVDANNITHKIYFPGLLVFEAAERNLWPLANRGGMEEFERRTCWTTYDNACVRTVDIPLYAEAMERFTNFYGPAMAGKAFSIPAQAADLRKIYAEAEATGWRGVTWDQTSVSEAWGGCRNIDDHEMTNWLPGADASVLHPSSERRKE